MFVQNGILALWTTFYKSPAEKKIADTKALKHPLKRITKIHVT
jgi:hypothetical protein